MGVYLPTSGRDLEIYSALGCLRALIEMLQNDHPLIPLYLRGDINVNPNNLGRARVFNDLIQELSIGRVELGHNTHHHYAANDGTQDAELDALLFVGPSSLKEQLVRILCSKEEALVTSDHDVIVSKFPMISQNSSSIDKKVKAPRVSLSRVKVAWNESNKYEYEALLSPVLEKLSELLTVPSSPSVTSVLLSATSFSLSLAASWIFKTYPLNGKKQLSPILDKTIKSAQIRVQKSKNMLYSLLSGQCHCPEEIDAAQKNLKFELKYLCQISRLQIWV